MFYEFNVYFEENPFNKLSCSATFEDICIGRKSCNLVNCDNYLIPLVRTTTNYVNKSEHFKQIHYDLIDKIKESVNICDLSFNNAMIEIYDNMYTNMRYHTDQSLDLDPNSYICIFSCYENNLCNQFRKLKIKEKNTNNHKEILMGHCSVVLFSVDTNLKHLHKIMLENPSEQNRWLGITFRLSKTLIDFKNKIPYFYGTSKVLKLADENERNNFMKYKKQENLSNDYVYPEIDYTVSFSDLLEIGFE